MKRKLITAFAALLAALLVNEKAVAQTATRPMSEPHRGQIHFSPKAHWVNDPNGMVYANGIYHLFFQYYPGGTTWGPMHWGHATSTDLVHWKERPIALYPDSLGYIFSGSAVVDKNNTSGLGKNGKAPLIAIYTSHDINGEKQKRTDYETQSIAYSTDDGATWTKYAGNPVIKNPGITDFRDPKLMWFEPTKRWIVTLATKDRITFFSSPDLKSWTRESEFGKDLGAHGGVWECPDLFPLNDNGKQVWVLLVNLNPGGPNGGSATQYFLGGFDGHRFTTAQQTTKWIDYGPDEYAGITWSNTGARKIFLGWMSNWMYANQVPTEGWRNGMTLPRELGLKQVNNEWYVTSKPVKELERIGSASTVAANVTVTKNTELAKGRSGAKVPCRIDLATEAAKSFTVTLSNKKGEAVVIGYDKGANEYFIDRTQSGKKDFNKDFAAKHKAPRFSKSANMNLSLLIDLSSVELFADDGLSVMTALFFPNEPYDKIQVQSTEGIVFKKLAYTPLKSIW